MKMRNLLATLYITLLLSSCDGQGSFVESRLKTADKFIDCLMDNNPDKVLYYTYPDVDDKIDNKELRDFHVNKAHNFIKKFGVPPKEKWIITHDPQNNFQRLLITIPLFKGYDTTFNLLYADLIIEFPPPQISDRISSYEISHRYAIKSTISVPGPPSVDSTRKTK